MRSRRSHPSLIVVGALTLILPTWAMAGQTPAIPGQDMQARISSLESRIASQEAELAQLRGRQQASWLNERRAEEIKALVRDTLADADTRASLRDQGVNAGYDNGFFITSDDGRFLLRTNVMGQMRYVYNDSKNTGSAIGVDPTPAGGDEHAHGFSLRSYRLNFQGHAIRPEFIYRLRISGGASNANATYDIAYVGYTLSDRVSVIAGNFKPRFLREENVSAYRQLAVEQSYSADYFAVDYSQGVELAWKVSDVLRVSGAFHDGSYAGSTEYNADRVDFALAGRADWLVKGTWKQFNDHASWRGEGWGLLVGGGVDYESGEGGSNNPDILKYTADVQAENNGLSLFAAITGQAIRDNRTGPGQGGVEDYRHANQLGVVLQAGLMVVPDKVDVFTRYEWLDFDGVYHRGGVTGNTGNPSKLDTLSILTVGGNYYLHRHAAKFTLQAMYAFDPVPANSARTGGLMATARSGQLALAGQFLFEF